MAAYAFHALEARLSNVEHNTEVNDADLPLLADVPGMFVTYEKLNGNLRGCIGTFSSCKLGDTLAKYSIISALQDSRFSPVVKSEVPGLKCSITILSDMVPTTPWNNWVIGQHGVYVTYTEAGRSYNATFLPSVIPEQGWGHRETLEHLLSKGGYRGRVTDAVLAQCEVQTYEGSKSSLTHPEYLAEYRGQWV